MRNLSTSAEWLNVHPLMTITTNLHARLSMTTNLPGLHLMTETVTAGLADLHWETGLAQHRLVIELIEEGLVELTSTRVVTEVVVEASITEVVTEGVLITRVVGAVAEGSTTTEQMRETTTEQMRERTAGVVGLSGVRTRTGTLAETRAGEGAVITEGMTAKGGEVKTTLFPALNFMVLFLVL